MADYENKIKILPDELQSYFLKHLINNNGDKIDLAICEEFFKK